MNMIEVKGNLPGDNGSPRQITINMNFVQTISELSNGHTLIRVHDVGAVEVVDKYMTVMRALRGHPWDQA